MTRICCFLISFPLLVLPALAQNTMAAMLTDKTPLTWIGVDYTAVQFIPREKFNAVAQHTLEYYRVWNKLFESEKEKYSICPFIKASDCTTMTSAVNPVNAQADTTAIWASGPFDKEAIHDMVRRYVPGDRGGVGCVYIATRYDATAETAEYHITFFDMATHDVLHVEKVVTKPGGASVRNYWASTALRVHELIRGQLRRSWMEQYVK